MRTADQVKRKLNELIAQKNRLELRQSDDELPPGTSTLIRELDGQILLLEWILNEPTGSYHS